MKIMLDPGHTGVTDPGAVAGGLREADVTLDVALKLRDLLAGVPGLEVRLTRDRHVDLATPYTQSADLRARTNMANNWPADVYLSIHVNAAANPEARGVETFHHVKASDEAVRVAHVLHRYLVPHFTRSRGVKSADFHVLRETRMPAVLVELGFITNDDDRRLLADEAFRRRLAEALATGLCEAFDLPAPATEPVPGPFKDVPGTHPAAAAIAAVKAAGLMVGYPDGTFRPDQPVTRAELAAVLQRLGLR